MNQYKIALLIFSNTKTEGPRLQQLFKNIVKEQDFGVIKDVQIFDHRKSLVGPIVEDYKTTNLGMIVLVAPDATDFFPYSELEEVGEKNEKFLITLNLDENIKENFLKIMEKVKETKGKPYKGCDSSCR